MDWTLTQFVQIFKINYPRSNSAFLYSYTEVIFRKIIDAKKIKMKRSNQFKHCFIGNFRD